MREPKPVLEERKHNLMKFWEGYFEFSHDEIEAFESVKREDFVTSEFKQAAYEDQPLPTLRGKTISQPTTVMMMTHWLELEPEDKVFEIGTGSGYQSAIIAKIVGKEGKVITSEIIPELVHFAQRNLEQAHITNVKVIEENGDKGFSQEAPFDKIIITAACKEFPKELIAQLKEGGIILGPVGDNAEQEMVRGVKRKDGTLEYEFLGQFLFSPLNGKYGFEE